MYEAFVDEFRAAILSSDLRRGETAIASHFNGVSIACAYGEDLTQPFVVAGWQIASADFSHLMLSINLRGHERAEFAATRLGYIIPMLVAYHQAGAPVLGHVNISVEDHCVWPGLSFCDTGSSSHLLPDPDFVLSSGYADMRSYYLTQPTPWIERTPIAFWRGSTNGRLHDVPNWRHLPRVRLCEIAATQPELFDVGLSQMAVFEPHPDELRASGLVRDFVPASAFQHYRFQIDIDGNSNAWAGLFLKLLTGSPVMKVASGPGFRQWYYERLVPWINYVPVQADMSDLIDNLRWLVAHDSAARLIGEAGRQLAMSMDFKQKMAGTVSTICKALRESSLADFEASSKPG